jgi:hypothetical protein
VIAVGSSNDAGLGLSRPAKDIDALLDTVHRGILTNNTGAFEGLQNACLVHLVTYQDFNRTLGSAYLSQNGNAGVCDRTGYNAGVTNVMFSSRKNSVRSIAETMAHEFGHNFGSVHDTDFGDDKCASLAEPYIMHPLVTEGKFDHLFSPCTQRSVLTNLDKHAHCLKDHDATPYLQYNGGVPYFATAPKSSTVQ